MTTQENILTAIADNDTDYVEIGTVGLIHDFDLDGYTGLRIRIGTDTTWVYLDGFALGEIDHYGIDLDTYFDGLGNIVG